MSIILVVILGAAKDLEIFSLRPVQGRNHETVAMDVVKLEPESMDKILSEVERILRSGGVVVVPTDTVYGLVGRADREEAIKKIFTIKKRPQEKAFPIFVKDIAAALKFAYISDKKAKFLGKVWPGPVTVVFHHKEKLPGLLTGGKDTVGIRIPNSQFLLELLARLKFPLVQTSANISDQPPAKNLKEVSRYFKNKKMQPNLIIEGGQAEGKASVVIDFTRNEPIVLRTGIVLKDELDSIFKSVE